MNRVYRVWCALVLCGLVGCGPSQADLLDAYKKAKAKAESEEKDADEARVAYEAAKRKIVKARVESLWNELPANHPDKTPGPREDVHYLTEDISTTKQRFERTNEQSYLTPGTRNNQEIEKKVADKKQAWEEQKKRAQRAAKAAKKAEAALNKK